MATRDPTPATDPPPADRFQTTQWTLVLAAGGRQSSQGDAALADLCRIYWRPLYAYIRRRVASVDEAHDLTQEFIARMLEKEFLATADRERGRFRSFLLTACKHFLANEWEKARARKRGGRRKTIPLDFAAADSRLSIEPADELTPDQLFDRQWALTLLTRVMDRLREEYASTDKQQQFELLKPFILGETGPLTYADAAESLGCSADAAKMAAHRMRKRYRQLLRDEIAQTVETPDDVEDEIRGLFRTFSG